MTGKKLSEPVYRYRAYGLSMESDLELPGLPPDPKTGHDTVLIQAESLAEPPDPASDSKWIEPQVARLYWADIGQFEISGGARIHHRIHDDCRANPGAFVQALLGPAMGLLLQQRGQYPLHASAIEFAGGALALLGDSGAGKSTLAQGLVGEGFRLITDDIAALRREAGETLVEPGLGALRLWPETLAGASMSEDDWPRLHQETDKRRVEVAQLPLDACALRAAVVLEFGEHIGIEQLASAEALMAFSRNIYYPELTLDAGQGPGIFAQAADLLEGVAVYRLTRPRDLQQMPAACAALRELIR